MNKDTEKGYMSNEKSLKTLQESAKRFCDVLKKRYCISDEVKDKIEKAKIEDNKRQCDISCEFANTCEYKGIKRPTTCFQYHYKDEIKQFNEEKESGDINIPDDTKTLQNGHRTGVQNECSGVKYDDNKPRLAEMFIDFCIPMEELCKVWTFGANKYEKSNWKKLDNAIDRYTNAMLRHLIAEEKETYDTESTYLHAAHIAFNALARLYFIKLKEQNND